MSTSGASESVVVDAAHYMVCTCLDGVKGRIYFDARRFGLMSYSCNEYFFLNAQMHEEWLIGVGGCTSQWQHWGRKGAIGSSAVDTPVDFRFYHCS